MSQVVWKRQYDRALRHKKRILDNLCNYIDDDPLLEDDFFDFCIHCYHLFEWFDNKLVARDYVEKNEYLVLCGGIANHSKHFIVNRYNNKLHKKDMPYRYVTSNTVSSSTGFSGEKTDSNIPANLDINQKHKMIVLADNKEYYLLDILNNSMLAWDDFIRQNRL